MDDNNTGTVHAHPTAEAASLNERLAIAEKRMREIEERREKREADREMPLRVAAAERAAADAEALEKAEEEHGHENVSIVKTDRLGCVIVKRPKSATYRKFADTGSTKTQDLQKLVRPCLVYPDSGVFDEMIETLPHLLHTVADSVVVLAGVRTKEVSEK